MGWVSNKYMSLYAEDISSHMLLYAIIPFENPCNSCWNTPVASWAPSLPNHSGIQKQSMASCQHRWSIFFHPIEIKAQGKLLHA